VLLLLLPTKNQNKFKFVRSRCPTNSALRTHVPGFWLSFRVWRAQGGGHGAPLATQLPAHGRELSNEGALLPEEAASPCSLADKARE